MSKRQLILASSSQQRKIILSTLGVDFKIVPSDFDEKSVKEENLAKRAEKLAYLKAEVVASKNPSSIVIGADTYGDLRGQALEKPTTIDEAKEMIRLQSGQWLKGYTGFAYLDLEKNIKINKVSMFEFKFRSLSKQEIDFYVENNPVTTWSAGFAPAYPAGAALIEDFKGSLTAFAYGLPIEWVVDGLKMSGVYQYD